MSINIILGQQHLGDTRRGRRGLCRISAIGAGHQHMDLAQLGGGGYGIQGGALQRLTIMFCDYQGGHQITFASFFNLSTSPATSSTMTPALRLGGSSTLRVSRRGVISTPKSSGESSSMGFFLAFMILGSDA